MSVITGRQSPATGPAMRIRPRWKVPDLCREFVESLAARARTVAGDHDGSDLPRPYWEDPLYNEASTLEEATGSVVTAAYVAARRIAGGADRLFGEVESPVQISPVVTNGKRLV